MIHVSTMLAMTAPRESFGRQLKMSRTAVTEKQSFMKDRFLKVKTYVSICPNIKDACENLACDIRTIKTYAPFLFSTHKKVSMSLYSKYLMFHIYCHLYCICDSQSVCGVKRLTN